MFAGQAVQYLLPAALEEKKPGLQYLQVAVLRSENLAW
jgi:hypothetical protein